MPEGIEQRIHPDAGDVGGVLVHGAGEPVKGFIFSTEAQMNEGDSERADGVSPGVRHQLFEDAARLGGASCGGVRVGQAALAVDGAGSEAHRSLQLADGLCGQPLEQERPAEVGMGVGKIRVEREGLAADGDRAVVVPRKVVGVGEVGGDDKGLRVEFCGASVLFDGLVVAPELGKEFRVPVAPAA